MDVSLSESLSPSPLLTLSLFLSLLLSHPLLFWLIEVPSRFGVLVRVLVVRARERARARVDKTRLRPSACEELAPLRHSRFAFERFLCVVADY